MCLDDKSCYISWEYVMTLKHFYALFYYSDYTSVWQGSHATWSILQLEIGNIVRKRCLISLHINFEWQIYHCLSLYHRVKNVSAAVNNAENLFGLLVCHCSYSELFPPVDFIQTVVWLDRVLTICLFFLLSKQDPRVHLQVLPGRACQLAFPKLLA